MSTTFLLDGGTINGVTLQANLQWHSSVNSKYMLENAGWAPVAADLAARPLAGRGPYEEIVEDRLVTVHGDGTDEVLANLETLVKLFDRAEQFARGNIATPVLIKFSTNQSSHFHEARITKRLPSDALHVTIPADFNEQAQRGAIEHVRLRYRRTIFIEPVGVENFMQNWSFEETGSTPALVAWTSSNAPTLTFFLGIANTFYPTHGNVMLQIDGFPSGAERGIFQDVTGLTAGVIYTVSVDVLWDTGTLILRATDGGGALNPVSTTVTSLNAWQRISIQKTCPAGGSIRVWLLSDSASPGRGNFDAVVLASGGVSVVERIDINQSTALIAGNPLITSLADHWTPSPIRAEIVMCDASGVETSNAYSHWPSFLVLTNDVNNLKTFGANTMATTLGTWTKPAAAGADQSYTGTLLRYTPVATTASKDPQIGVLFGTTIPTYSKLTGIRVVVFVVCRASVANQFTIRGYISDDTGPHNFEVASEPVVLTSTATTIVPLIFPAPLRITRNFGSFAFQLEATSNVAAGTLDFDRVTAVNVSPAEETTIIRFNESLDRNAFSVNAGRLFAEAAPTTRRAAAGGIINSAAATGEQPFSTEGNLELYMRGPQVAGLWIAVGDARAAAPGTLWQFYDSTGAFVVRTKLRTTRRKARVTPR